MNIFKLLETNGLTREIPKSKMNIFSINPKSWTREMCNQIITPDCDYKFGKCQTAFIRYTASYV